jgi:hypothetical protein
MKLIIAFAIFSLQCAVAFAQTTDTAARNTGSTLTPVIIRLNFQPEKKYQCAFPVRDVEVMIANGDTTRLGFVQTGVNNKLREARPDRPIQQYIHDYIQDTYKEQYKSEAPYLLIVIKYFRIGERTGIGREKAFVRLKADAFRSDDNISYQLACTFDTVLERKGADVTKRFSQYIGESIDLLMAAADKQSAASRKYPREEIVKRELRLYDAPAYNMESYTDGVYLTYNEFINNKPSVTAFKPLFEANWAKIYALSRDSSSTTLIPAPWGMCYKGQLYLYAQRNLIPFSRDGRAFLFRQYLHTEDRNKSVALASAAKAGLIGLAVPNPMFSQNIMNVTDIPHIEGILPEATTIDPFSGKLMF